MAYGTIDKPESVRKLLGQHLRNARKQAAFTVPELAEALGVTPTFVRAVERGEVACDVLYVLRLLKMYGMPEACPR
jgi:transcriptional regulator with XRE-family HTH domain